jgi:hypothetical protein
MNEYRDLWSLVELDLARARQMLPDDAKRHDAVWNYQEFIENNELELACDELERYAHEHVVPREFWTALRDAAIKMQLFDRANQYEQSSN